jgi:hypothetical protein
VFPIPEVQPLPVAKGATLVQVAPLYSSVAAEKVGAPELPPRANPAV